MSRPEKPIDWDKVDKLLLAGCHGTEIAPHFNMHPDTFYNRMKERYNLGFTEYSTIKKQEGDSLLRAAQYQKALKGDNTMMIWLGKQRMGQKENLDPQVPNQAALDITHELIMENKKLKEEILKFSHKEANKDSGQKEAMDELVEQAQELKMGYE